MPRHWAEIDPNTNIVKRVILCDDFTWITKNLGGAWVETFNPNEQPTDASRACGRKNYAGIGFTWDKSCDGFVPPCKYKSWVLDAQIAMKVAPVTAPKIDEKTQALCWDEKNIQYVVCKKEDYPATQKTLDQAAGVDAAQASADGGLG